MRTEIVQEPVNLRPYVAIIFASLLIGACAQIKIPLWFSPVPITGQTLGVMGIGAWLGARRGSVAALLYLIEGSLGMPVFAGGNSGAAYLLGATGGYLLAYPLEAFLMGLLLERGRILLAMLLPCLQLAIGSLWLIPFIGVDQIFQAGFYPFVLIEITKALIVILFHKTRAS